MLDDDIQYMGTRPALRQEPVNPFPAPQIVTGIILHVEKSGTDSPYAIIFRRVNSNVIQIGRRPGSEVERRQGDTGRAMFRCAVVSRKHAKIAFSDSGHAYLIDLNSHHGTHVRKIGEISSRMLVPETPAMLADGDVLTFGKSVGRNNETVRPVVARVELLRGPRTESPGFKLISVESEPATPRSDNANSSSSRSSSGRYGIYPSSSSSDDHSSPIPDHDSDIEEIPASGANALPLQPRGSLSTESGSHLGRAFEVLKRLLPPVHTPSPPIRQALFEPFYNLARPDFSLNSPGYDPGSPIYSPDSPSQLSFRRSISPMFDPHSPIISPTGGDIYSKGFDAADHDILLQDHANAQPDKRSSRSTSPMDLASPSPPPSAHLSPDPERPIEPSIIGAWPGSRSPSLVPSPSLSGPFEEAQPRESVPSDNDTTRESGHPMSLSEAPGQAQLLGSTISAPEAEYSVPSVPEPVLPNKLNEVSELQSGLEKLRNEVEKLQVHRRKYKSKFNTNVRTISSRLYDLDDRVSDVNAQYSMLLDQVENVNHIDIPDLQAQVGSLQREVEALPSAPSDVTSGTLLHERKDVEASVQTLKELVDEMRKLRESTEKHMAAELEAVRAARDAALATIAAHAQAQVQVQAPQTPVPASLKRKRSNDKDEDEDEDVVVAEHEVVDDDDDEVGAGAGDAADVTMADAAVPTTFTTTTRKNKKGIDVPSPKRARKVMSVVVQTATAVTVGAVATWSALAFS